MTHPNYELTAIRAQFPVLAQQVHGKPLAYLDNAASGQKPQAVLDAVHECYASYYANIHRGVHRLSERSTAAFERAREQVRTFVNAEAADEIVFVRGTTEAINLVAHSFLRPRLEPGDEVLLTEMEHHSNIVPWQLVCAERGATVRAVPVLDDGSLDLGAYAELLGPKTRLVALAHVSNVLGTVNPVAEMVRTAHARGVPVLVDGAQAVPHLAVDVRRLGCDFYAFSGHKVYAPSGIGALYGKAEHLAAMPPYQGGGGMIRRVTLERTSWADPPARFEAGTPAIAEAIGLGAALDWLRALGIEAVAAHEAALERYASHLLAEIPGLRLIGTAAHKAAVVSFAMERVHPHDIGTILDREGIAIRVGHHCAQPLMDRFGVPATARASFAAYNTRDEVDALAKALWKVKEWFD